VTSEQRAARRLSAARLQRVGHCGSEAAAQPRCIGNGRLWLAFDGEVYTYAEIHRERDGIGG